MANISLPQVQNNEKTIKQNNVSYRKQTFNQIAFLIWSSLFMFGSMYVFSLPAATRMYLVDDGMTPQTFGILAGIYSYPNIILPLFGGVLIDYYGVRLSLVLFCVVVFIGHLSYVYGVCTESVFAILLGRFIFGLGGECLGVANSTVVANWYTGKDLSLCLTISLTISGLGTVAVFNSQPFIIEHTNLFIATIFSLLSMLLMVISVVMSVVMDHRADVYDAIYLNDEVVSPNLLINHSGSPDSRNNSIIDEIVEDTLPRKVFLPVNLTENREKQEHVNKPLISRRKNIYESIKNRHQTNRLKSTTSSPQLTDDFKIEVLRKERCLSSMNEGFQDSGKTHINSHRRISSLNNERKPPHSIDRNTLVDTKISYNQNYYRKSSNIIQHSPSVREILNKDNGLSIIELPSTIEDESSSLFTVIRDNFKLVLRDVSKFNKLFWLLAIVLTCSSLTPFFSVVSQSFLTTKFHLKSSAANFFASVPTIYSSILGPVFGLWIDKFGRRPLFLSISCGLYILTYSTLLSISFILEYRPNLFQFYSGNSLAWITYSLLGLASSVFSASLWSCIPLVVDKSNIGTAYGVIFSSQAVGLSITPFILELLHAGDPSFMAPFIFLISCSMIAFFSSIFVGKYDFELNGAKLRMPCFIGETSLSDSLLPKYSGEGHETKTAARRAYYYRLGIGHYS